MSARPAAPLVAVVGLRHWRQLANLSQVELAKRLKVTNQTVSDWETGRAHPRLATARRLMRILGAPSLEALFPEEEVV